VAFDDTMHVAKNTARSVKTFFIYTVI